MMPNPPSLNRNLQHELMRPELFQEFCAQYTREINRLRMEKTANIRMREVEFAKVTRELDKLIDAILEGVPAQRVKQRMIELESHRADLEQEALNTKLPEPYLHPNMADTYRQKVAELARAISSRYRHSEGGARNDPVHNRERNRDAGRKHYGHRSRK